MLNLNERGMTDDKLAALFNNVPPRSIVLLEDVDCVFVQRANQMPSVSREHTLTFSGLLNALDGVSSTEERIIFMTTNYIDRLDEALIRPGRVDVQQYIGYATADQIRRIFLRFYPDSVVRSMSAHQPTSTYLKSVADSSDPSKDSKDSHSESTRQSDLFVSALQESGVHFSIADLQGWFLLHKDQPHAAVKEVDMFIEQKRYLLRHQTETRSQQLTTPSVSQPSVIKIRPLPE